MSESRVRPWRTLALMSVLVGLPISGCDCGGPTDVDGGPDITCGAGTVLEDGVCVAEGTPEQDGGPALECGDGTVLNASGTACVPDLDCPDGTTENDEGTGCQLVCESPFLYVAATDSCECALGLRETDDGTSCEIDPALCGEGTLFQAGACVPIEAPPPADDDLNGGAPVVIELDDSKPVEVGGVIGPVDRVDGPDVDVFEFTTTAAFTRVRIQLVSFGLPNGAFIVSDNESGIEAPAYQRVGIGGVQRRAVRELTLPFAGTYSIVVSDISNLTGSPIPVGSDDADYALSIEILTSSPATAALVDGTEYTGQHESVDAYRVETTTAPVGSILNAVLAGNDTLDPNCDTQQVLWYVDSAGDYQEFAPNANCTVNALLPQPTAGIRFHVDYYIRTGGQPYDYSLSINDVPVSDGPNPNDGPLDGTTDGEQLSFFRMTAVENHVYRARAQFPSTSTLDAAFLLVNAQDLTVVQQGATVTSGGATYLEMQFYVDSDEAGNYFLVIADASNPSPFVTPNYNVRFTLDDAEVAFSANPSIAGGPVATTEPKPVANDWLGPWTMVRVDEIAVLTIATDTDVGFSAFSPDDMSPIAGELPGRPVLPELTSGVNEGACDAADANIIDTRGKYTVDYTTRTDNFVDVTGGPDWDNCSRPGNDLSVRIANQPAGTRIVIETLSEGDNGGTDTYIGLIDTADCDEPTAVCLAQDDDDGDGTRSFLEYVTTGLETNMILNIDAFSATGLLVGNVVFTVDFIPPANELQYEIAPGSRVLTKATGGDATGDFIHTATASASPYAWETEPNNSSATANPLPLDADPALNGFLATGDFDWWQIDVPEAGLLTVSADQGPLALNDAALTLAIVDTDGSTELSSVTGFLALDAATYVVAAGTYYATVGATESLAAFDYTLNWSLDTAIEPPSTCDVPKVIDGPGAYAGNTGGLNVWEDTSGCLSASSGVAPETYENVPDDVWSVTIPVGATIELVASSEGDLAIALITGGCESGTCLAAADLTFPFFDPVESETIVYTNNGNAPVNGLFIVTTFGNAPADYTLDVQLVGSTCFPGQTRCNVDATALETCGDDGNTFDAIECSAGCAFDEFEQLASCNLFCGAGTDKPAVDCNEAASGVLTCAADQGRYEEAACDVAECTTVVDVDDIVVDAFCTFGVCPTPDSTTCSVETIDGFGDVAVLRSCNPNASESGLVSCADGCNVDGDACAGGAPNPITVLPNNGLCEDTGTSDLIDTSSTFTLTLDAASGIDSGSLTCSSTLGFGNDAFFRLPGDLPAGSTATIRELSSLDVVLATYTDCAETCVGRTDTPEVLTYTYTGDEAGDVYVLVKLYFSSSSGDVEMQVDFVTPAPQICDETDNTCDTGTNVATTCNATNDGLASIYCVDACSAIHPTRCNDSCDLAEAVEIGADETYSVAVEPYLGNDTVERPCSVSTSTTTGGHQPEAVVAFTATVDGTAFVDASVGPDIVVAVFDDDCTSTELYCGDSTESTTIDVVAGGRYLVLVENYSSATTQSPTTVEITVTPDP